MRGITTPFLAGQLIGRKILLVDLRAFDDGRGGRAFAPEITLDDGSTLSFVVQETETGEYGIEMQRGRVRKRPSRLVRVHRSGRDGAIVAVYTDGNRERQLRMVPPSPRRRKKGAR